VQVRGLARSYSQAHEGLRRDRLPANTRTRLMASIPGVADLPAWGDVGARPAEQLADRVVGGEVEEPGPRLDLAVGAHA
jgi:hypothetical protein